MARTVTTFQESDSFKRQITLMAVDKVSEILPLPKRGSTFYTLMLLMDGRPETNADLGNVPEELLKEGLAYLCSWGPACGRVHDIFDEVVVDLEIRSGNEYNPMTTWHENESIEETLWFFLNSAWPDEKYANDCGSALIVSVGNSEWSSHLSSCLTNVASFNDRALNSES